MLITTKQVAQRSGLLRATISKMASQGAIDFPDPKVRGHRGTGEQNLFDEDEISAWLASRASRGYADPVYSTGVYRSNPWAFRDIHAECGSGRWSMPYNGDSTSTLWICLNHPHTVFYRREAT